MNEHEKTIKAARQVEVMMGFYIHFVVFLLVCLGLLVVNWLATPEVWWALWPFLGWGIGVVGHALCAFGRPNPITSWRLRKIRELSDPTRSPSAARSSPLKTVGLLLLGLLIGSVIVGAYMYTQVQNAREEARRADASRAALDKTAKEQDVQLKQLSAEKSSLEGTIKETRDQLTRAEAARDAAERALGEAKKERPQ